jgi:1-acyl-sn-glycerol-3-phosphate acyltransferase
MDGIVPLRRLRSLASLTLLLIGFPLGGLFQRVFIWPLAWAFPRLRLGLISAYMHLWARIVLVFVRAGGGTFERSGTISTRRPVLILMNHQSLLDIPIATALCTPFSPAFVTRRRYARGVPLVSQMLKLRRCPIVEPEVDPRGAIATLKKTSREEQNGILIFPEGHRSDDGQISPFNSAGVRVILRERRVPVYLVVTDGVWVGRRLQDFLLGMHHIRGRTEILGPFEPPASDADLEPFVESMRAQMVSCLDSFRKGPDVRS